MRPIKISEVSSYVQKNIGSFHAKRLLRLNSLKLKTVLKRKNPYLFKAKNIGLANDLVKVLVDAHLSSQEETIFGDFLEGLAIFISGKVYGGKKSAAEGIDLEFSKDGIVYIVAIKSGPNWGNSSQIRRMINDFNSATKRLHTSLSTLSVRAINGCCYGIDKNPNKGSYEKLCGQRFWEFISGNPELYLDIIEPLGHRAKQKNAAFQKRYDQILNRFTKEFIEGFCDDGVINWERLVKFNSSTVP